MKLAKFSLEMIAIFIFVIPFSAMYHVNLGDWRTWVVIVLYAVSEFLLLFVKEMFRNIK